MPTASVPGRLLGAVRRGGHKGHRGRPDVKCPSWLGQEHWLIAGADTNPGQAPLLPAPSNMKSSVWFGLKTASPPSSLTAIIVFIGVDEGVLTFGGLGKIAGIHTAEHYLPAQDGDGDGFPGPGPAGTRHRATGAREYARASASVTRA